MNKIHYGIWTYDVPLKRKNLYNRLRNKTKRFAIPLTMSAYLVPYETKECIDLVVDDANKDATGAPRPVNEQMKSVILKFDDSEQSKLSSIAVDGVQKIIANAKSHLGRRLRQAQDDMETYEKKGKLALTKAKNQLKQAQQLSVVFALGDDLGAGFEAFSILLDQKTEIHKAKAKEHNESVEKALIEEGWSENADG